MYVYVTLAGSCARVEGGGGGERIRANRGVAAPRSSLELLEHAAGCSRQTSLPKRVLTTFCLFRLPPFTSLLRPRRSLAPDVRYGGGKGPAQPRRIAFDEWPKFFFTCDAAASCFSPEGRSISAVDLSGRISPHSLPPPPPRSYPRIRVRPENSICRIAEVPSLCPVRAVFISSLSKSKRFRSGFDWIVPRCRLIRFNSFAIPRTEYPAPVLCRLTCNGEHGTLVLTPCLHRACTVLCNNCSYTSSVYRGKVPCRARLLRRVQTARARPRVRDDIDIL